MRKEIKLFQIMLLFIFGLITPNTQSWAQTSNQMDWTAHTPNETETIDHSYWGLILSKIVIEGNEKSAKLFKTPPPTTSRIAQINQSGPLKKGINLISYELVGKSETAKAAVKEYVGYLQTFNPLALNKNEQLAFWLNLHNSVFVESILNEYPVKSMRKLGIEKRNQAEFYQKKRVNIEGRDLSLYDLETIVLLVGNGNLLIPYGLVLGSHSTPNILTYSFSGETVHSQLEAAARHFINNVGVRTKGKTINYSPFYDMFSDVYMTEGEKGLKGHLMFFANQKRQNKMGGLSRLKGMKLSAKLNALPASTMRAMKSSQAGKLQVDAGFNLPSMGIAN